MTMQKVAEALEEALTDHHPNDAKIREALAFVRARLRSSLATAERERDEAREKLKKQSEVYGNFMIETQGRARNAETKSIAAQAALSASQDRKDARATALEALLTEARENQAASQRMTASVERSLDRSIALHEATEALLTEAGKALGKLASANALAGVRALVAGWNGEDRPEPYERHPPQRGANLPKTTCGAVYELDEALTGARDLLTRIEAREGGEGKGRG